MSKKKILKIIGIILLVVIVIFIIHTIRNYNIITDLQDKIAEYSDSTNYYTKSVTTESDGTIVTMEYYKKDNREVVFLERNQNGEISKISMYNNGERTDTFWDNKDNKIVQLDSGEIMSVNFYNYTETDNKWQTFLGSIIAKVKSTNYNDKECYIIKGFLSSPSRTAEIYIEKDTGLLIKTSEEERITEREYEFNNVDESIFTEPDISQYTLKENNTSSTEDTKNYDKNMKIAYENDKDKENSKLVYLNDNNKSDYNWNEYIIENKTILKDMPDVDFTQFEELDNDFHCLKITDYTTYEKMADNYNLKTLDKNDFDNIFVEIIIRKSSDNSIKCEDIIKGYEFVSNEENYTIPVTVGGTLDVSENFKYPCIIGYFPNYMNEHYSDFFFKVLATNEDITVSKDKAVTIAQNYLKELTYGGCYNFSNMDYVRIENRYANNFLNTDEKENPIDDTSKKYTVWSVSAYSENDPCTWANVYVDVVTGEIIGGNLNFATD